MFRNALRLFIGAAVLAAASASADIVILDNNTMFVGDHVSIVNVTDEFVIIEYINEGKANSIILRRSEVVRMVRSDEPSSSQSSSQPSSIPEPPVQPGDDSELPPGFLPETTPPSATPSQEWGVPASPPAIEPMDEFAPLLPVVIPQGQVYTVAGVNVSFREGPDQVYPSIMRLLSGDLLIEIEELDGWLHVSTVSDPPRRGWVHTMYVQALDNVPSLVVTDRAIVRETPDEASLRIGTLNEGAVVIKLEDRAGWSRVLRDASTAGWTQSNNLEPLSDTHLLQPSASVRRNQEAGQPVHVERQRDAFGEIRQIFTLRDQSFVRDGLVKLIALHRDRSTSQASSMLFSGRDILSRERIESSLGLVGAGIPEQVAANYHGAEIFTLMGRETSQGWTFELTASDQAAANYAIMIQRGAERGTLILLDDF